MFTSSRSNRSNLLAALPADDLRQIAPDFTTVDLAQGSVLFEANDEVSHVYFPHSGTLSLLVVLQDGRGIETATVGREGVVGAMAGFGISNSLVRITVQLPVCASKIPSARFRKAVESNDALRNLCIRYNETLLSQARVTAACNAVHLIEARFCRWLLQSSDRAESNVVMLTQELLAEMLGVRRTSVTKVAGKMQDDRLISFSRGRIAIIDRGALEARACECYQTLLEQSATLGPKTIERDAPSHTQNVTGSNHDHVAKKAFVVSTH